jgi:ribosomal protein S18 acetylase RimI-like enzyme
MTQVTLAHVDSTALWVEARRLIEEYAASLDFDLAFQDFDRELRSLHIEYAPPSGAFVLAGHDGHWIACGGVRRFSESACEMKRLYVSPAGRGRGVGREIAEALIDAARRMRYRTMLLDTTPSKTRAQQIYTSLGFTTTAPYRYNPIDGASYWRLDLLAI